MPLMWVLLLRARYRKPPGNNCGQRCDAYPRACGLVTGVGLPPDAGTWKRPDSNDPNKMRPSVSQAPPRLINPHPGVSQIASGVPPAKSTRSILPAREKPIDLLSGDQKG